MFKNAGQCDAGKSLKAAVARSEGGQRKNSPPRARDETRTEHVPQQLEKRDVVVERRDEGGGGARKGDEEEEE